MTVAEDGARSLVAATPTYIHKIRHADGNVHGYVRDIVPRNQCGEVAGNEGRNWRAVRALQQHAQPSGNERHGAVAEMRSTGQASGLTQRS